MTHHMPLLPYLAVLMAAVLAAGCGDKGPSPAGAGHPRQEKQASPPARPAWSAELMGASAKEVHWHLYELGRSEVLHWKSRVEFEGREKTLLVDAWFGPKFKMSHLMGGPNRPDAYRNVSDGENCVITYGGGVLVRKAPARDTEIIAFMFRPALIEGVSFWPLFASPPRYDGGTPEIEAYESSNHRFAPESGTGPHDARVIEYRITRKKTDSRYEMKVWVEPGPRITRRTGRGSGLSSGLQWQETVEICSMEEAPPAGIFDVK